MSTILKPGDEKQAEEAVAWALAEEEPLELVGAGSKRHLGRPQQTNYVIDLSAIAGIQLYEPEELVMTAGPGTPLVEIEAAIAKAGQRLAFEPGDLGPLLGEAPGRGTIGGVFACNLAGPRRIKDGAARDHFLGMRAVTGRGELVKSGGRVVKNVTGYDLCKLMAGSYGTLAAMTALTFKVLPVPEKVRTVLVFGLDDDRAMEVMSEAARTPHDVSGLAHLPQSVARRNPVDYVADAEAPVTAIRIEGPAPSVDHRTRALREAFADRGATEELHGHNSEAFWQAVRDVQPFVEDDRAVWRLSVAPKAGAATVARLAATTTVEAYYDWAGGLIWAAVDADEAAATAVRGAIEVGGGHATLVRGPDGLRAAVPVFQPQPPALAALTRRVKESFDPRGILNPGRMYPGG